MKFVTVATEIKGYLPVLQESFIKQNLKLEILGLNEKWTGFGFKYLKMIEFLKKQNPYEIIVFMDAYDVIFLNKDKLLERFRSYNKQILLSCEPLPKTLLHKYLYTKVFPYCQLNEKDKIHINSGLYMGYAKYLLIMLQELSNKENLHSSKTDDQIILNEFCNYKNNFFSDHIAIDIERKVFYNTFPDSLFTQKTSKKLINSKFVNKNLEEVNFVHGPGNTNLDFIIQKYNLNSKNKIFREDFSNNTIKIYYIYFWKEILIIVLFVILIGYFLIKYLKNK
jgi:hypothetical protein